jgi:uncharacterized membrane protein (GlpM family)
MYIRKVKAGHFKCTILFSYITILQYFIFLNNHTIKNFIHIYSVTIILKKSQYGEFQFTAI